MPDPNATAMLHSLEQRFADLQGIRRCCQAAYGHLHVVGCINHPDTVVEFDRLEPLLWEGDYS